FAKVTGRAPVEPRLLHARGQSGMADIDAEPGVERRPQLEFHSRRANLGNVEVVGIGGLRWAERELDDVAESLAELGRRQRQAIAPPLLVETNLAAGGFFGLEVGIPAREAGGEVLQER